MLVSFVRVVRILLENKLLHESIEDAHTHTQKLANDYITFNMNENKIDPNGK